VRIPGEGERAFRRKVNTDSAKKLLPDILVAAQNPTGTDFRHVGFVAPQFCAVMPRDKLGLAVIHSAGHLQHEVEAGNHQARLQESELHVLAAHGG